jgi:glycosyltransferase involved in cell wall biosynthesis
MSNFSPQISIYVPVHNNAQDLVQCLQSLIDQNIDRAELLIIDDASEDSSLTVINEFLEVLTEKFQVRVLKLKENVGLPEVISLAIAESNADIIMRVDADDWLFPGAIGALYAKITESNETGLVYGNYVEYFEGDGSCREVKLSSGLNSRMADALCHGAGMVFRKSLLDQAGGFDSQFLRDDGIQILMKLKNNWKTIHIDEFIFSYRQHPNQKTADKQARNKERLNLLNHIADDRFTCSNLQIGFSNYSNRDENSKKMVWSMAERIFKSVTGRKKIIYTALPSVEIAALAIDFPSIEFRARSAEEPVGIYAAALAALQREQSQYEVVTIVTDDYPNDSVGYIDLGYHYMVNSEYKMIQSGRVFANLVYGVDDFGAIALQGGVFKKSGRDPVFLRCGGVSLISASALRDAFPSFSELISQAGFFEVDEIAALQRPLPTYESTGVSN